MPKYRVTLYRGGSLSDADYLDEDEIEATHRNEAAQLVATAFLETLRNNIIAEVEPLDEAEEEEA